MELHFSCFANKKPSRRKNSSVPYVAQTVGFLVVCSACITPQYGRQIARQLDKQRFQAWNLQIRLENLIPALSVRIWPNQSVSFEETETKTEATASLWTRLEISTDAAMMAFFTKTGQNLRWGPSWWIKYILLCSILAKHRCCNNALWLIYTYQVQPLVPWSLKL